MPLPVRRIDSTPHEGDFVGHEAVFDELQIPCSPRSSCESRASARA